MKRLITIILILAVLLPAAALADLPDISELKPEELLELNRRIQIQLFGEKLAEGIDVPASDYIVGEDIPAGTYRMTVKFPSSGGTLVVYETSEKRKKTFNSSLGEFWGVVEIGKVELEEGNLVHIHGNTLTFFPYTGLFN